MRRLGGLTVGLTLTLLLGVPTVSVGSFPASAAEPQKLTIQAGAPVPYISFLPLYIGQQAGFMKEEGVDIDIRYSSGAAQATQVVAAGQADVGWQTIEPVISGYEKGIRGKAFMRLNNQLIFYIAVPEDSPIKKMEDLKGKKIGVANFGSGAVPVVRSMLRSAGITPEADTLLPVGVMDQAMSALRSGNVAALGLYDGIYWGLERAGFKFRYFYHPQLAQFGNGVAFANQTTIDTKREQICGLGRAFAKSVLFMLENPEAALKMWWKVSPAAKRGATEEEAVKNGLAELLPTAKTYDLGFPPKSKYGTIDRASYDVYTAVLQQEGVVTKAPKFDDIITNSFDDCINQIDVEKVRKLAREWKQ